MLSNVYKEVPTPYMDLRISVGYGVCDVCRRQGKMLKVGTHSRKDIPTCICEQCTKEAFK